MAETPEEVARKLLAEIHHGVLCLEQAERHASVVASALRAQRVTALEAAALEYADPKLESIKVYCRHVAQRLRQLAEQAKRTP